LPIPLVSFAVTEPTKDQIDAFAVTEYSGVVLPFQFA